MLAKFLINIFGVVAAVTLVAGLSLRAVPAVASQEASHAELFRVPCAREGIVEFLGIAVRPGAATGGSNEKEIAIEGKKFKFRTLRVGDLLEAGEVIGRLEDRQAQAEVKIQQSKVAAAEADKASSSATRAESHQRWLDVKKLNQTKEGVSVATIRDRENTYHRYLAEENAKEAAVELAKTELVSAQKVLDSYLIRSTARGIIRRIHKHPGEAVRKLETIVTLELLEANPDEK